MTWLVEAWVLHALIALLLSLLLLDIGRQQLRARSQANRVAGGAGGCRTSGAEAQVDAGAERGRVRRAVGGIRGGTRGACGGSGQGGYSGGGWGGGAVQRGK